MAQFKQFKVVIKEIPNQYIDRGVNYKQVYVITADNATEAKQDALDRFGDYSKVESCSEIDHDYPEQYEYDDEE